MTHLVELTKIFHDIPVSVRDTPASTRQSLLVDGLVAMFGEPTARAGHMVELGRVTENTRYVECKEYTRRDRDYRPLPRVWLTFTALLTNSQTRRECRVQHGTAQPTPPKGTCARPKPGTPPRQPSAPARGLSCVRALHSLGGNGG